MLGTPRAGRCSRRGAGKGAPQRVRRPIPFHHRRRPRKRAGREGLPSNGRSSAARVAHRLDHGKTGRSPPVIVSGLVSRRIACKEKTGVKRPIHAPFRKRFPITPPVKNCANSASALTPPALGFGLWWGIGEFDGIRVVFLEMPTIARKLRDNNAFGAGAHELVRQRSGKSRVVALDGTESSTIMGNCLESI